jgi:hypothetical protein
VEVRAMPWEIVVPVVVVGAPIVALVLTRRGRTGDPDGGHDGVPDSADRSVLHCAAPIPPSIPRRDPAR